ncbi:MAG: hypothetical protein NC417_13820 [Candidatus Gastranaerophilales bacterium]|nr:hypothetical protein [Candidatus Gastranaerophilales bacterium]
MRIDLAGEWDLHLDKDEHERGLPDPASGKIMLPGTLQAAGYGYTITRDTEWMSGLHNPFWYEREEYQDRREGENEFQVGPRADGVCKVPFLAQPKRHYIGVAHYERTFRVAQAEAEAEWTLRLELARWRSKVYIDGAFVGEDCSLCAPHEILCGRLSAGEHRIRVEMDSGMQYPYRPDGHGVSDALGAVWNGMVGEIALLSGEEMAARREEKSAYANAHPVKIETKDGVFLVDGVPTYFRGTHFGGDFPLTGYPATDLAWWKRLMQTVKTWGFNFIRCHSYCPPEAAFLAADEEGVYLQPECGMWNYFDDDDRSGMYPVLQRETVKILKEFGHHPSFVLFSPTNEPAGEWYHILRRWVSFARETDAELGYAGRRLYTAQSGWFYDVPPDQISGTDYIYFHRSGFGPYRGGMIRNTVGWRGKDYDPSLEGCKLPVICHEMGQWCAYPDFDRVIPKFTGFLEPGNFEIFRENARKAGVLSLAGAFAHCSGKNQVRLLKEEMEANRRTKCLQGFEFLDLHDYLGQGAALVGVLDAFWESKGYVTPDEFREFCGDTVLLTRLPSYVYHSGENIDTPVIVSHYGGEALQNETLVWRLRNVEDESVYAQGEIAVPYIPVGKNVEICHIEESLSDVIKNVAMVLELELKGCGAKNHWDIYVFVKPNVQEKGEGRGRRQCVYTKDFVRACEALERGEAVLYTPYLSDLDYDCTPLSYRNVFWNAQMGPKWSRSMGLLIQEGHPIFREFPTERDGGWNWADILERSRGFCLDQIASDFQPVVRAIDDWNRNIPQSLILEAQVGRGRLLLVSADLEGSFEERPAAYSLKRALLRYLESGEYVPAAALTVEQISAHICSVTAGKAWIADIVFKGAGKTSRHAREALLDPNPNFTCVLEGKAFPMQVDLKLIPEEERTEEKGRIRGLVYLSVQTDRMFEGCICEYQVTGQYRGESILLDKGFFQNSLHPQHVLFPKQLATSSGEEIDPSRLEQISLRILSCYGQGERVVWKEGKDGWERSVEDPEPKVQFAALSLLCTDSGSHSDEIFWDRHERSNTREIEA